MSPKSFLIMMGSILILSGCAVIDPYQRIDPENKVFRGYKDYVQDDGTQIIEFLLPVNTGAEPAYALWHRRAQEICGNGDYDHNIFNATRNIITSHEYGSAPSDYVLKGTVKCQEQ